MPLYEYQCETCGEEFEQIVSFSKADLLPPCPHCKGEKHNQEDFRQPHHSDPARADRMPPPAVIAEQADLPERDNTIRPCAGNSEEKMMQIRDETSKSKLIKRLKRIEGQVRGVQAMLERRTGLP